MAQTRYITAAELAETYDSRTLAEISSDDGSPAEVSETNAVVLNAIERASADVESYALRGGRLSAADLTSLVDADDWTLKGIVAALAVAHLYRRRGRSMPEDVRSAFENASKSLKDLDAGRQVFNLAASIKAGKPATSVVSVNTRADMRFVSDQPFFPSISPTRGTS